MGECDVRVEPKNTTGWVMQRGETAAAFVCERVARILITTSTIRPLDSLSDVWSTANGASSGLQGARLNWCQLIVQEDESHHGSRAEGSIWMLDEEIRAEVLQRWLEISGKSCHDKDKAVSSSFVEGVSCGVHSNNFAVHTPADVGAKAELKRVVAIAGGGPVEKSVDPLKRNTSWSLRLFPLRV